ncbi:MAG: hypothetical protein K8W52_12425 [Deltaproteobacteria bacterium]|nr:hypothetical protein [Deltaproteobacteria bacterium]
MAGAATADPAPTTLEGDVVAARGRWTEDGLRIVTDATIRTSDGTEVDVLAAGGAADGFGQITYPGTPWLEPGLHVNITGHRDTTRRGRSVLVVDDATIATGGGAAPFVREGPVADHYLYWASGCIILNYDSAGTAEVAGDAEFPELDAAAQAWNTGTAGCSYMNLQIGDRVTGREAGKDYVNTVIFRDRAWCSPEDTTDPKLCHNPAAAALTTLTFIKDPKSARVGEIVDADVEFNGVDFAIAVGGQTTGTSSCKSDLLNTATHEFGHVLGLEHTCRAPNDPARVDGDGVAVPFCTSTTDPAITEATMYPYEGCAETSKVSLEADDIAGACAIAPKADDPGSCAPVPDPTQGCCQAGDGGRSSSVLLALGLALAIRRRRQR